MFIVVSYDITDNGRRAAVASEAENFGTRVQRSVFECHLSEEDFTELRRRLTVHIAAGVDSIKYYMFCAKDERRVMVDGVGEVTVDRDYFIV